MWPLVLRVGKNTLQVAMRKIVSVQDIILSSQHQQLADVLNHTLNDEEKRLLLDFFINAINLSHSLPQLMQLHKDDWNFAYEMAQHCAKTAKKIYYSVEGTNR